MTTASSGPGAIPGQPLHAPGGMLFGYPKGVLLLSFTELWERFSYFGLMAIMVLFVTAGVPAGGFGWAEADALKLYGWYSALAFSVPLIGGWIANNYLGERRCILIGGILIVCGHLLLAGPKFVPELANWWSGADYRALWIAAGVPLGRLFPDADLQRLADAALVAGIDPAHLALVYRGIALTFFGGLGFVICGTALLKPTISSIVGRFYSETDVRRDSAFALFMVGIYVGEISGVFITGFIGEKVAWHWGFAAAGIGMTFGLLNYLANQQRLLADLGVAPVGGRSMMHMLRNLSGVEVDRIKVILVQASFTAVYSCAVFQTGGLLTLFAREHVDRDAWGWEIPASWFMTITSILFIILTPPAARLWERLAVRGRNPRASLKLAMGLAVIGVAFLVIAYAMHLVDTGGQRVSPLWLIGMYLLFGVSEVLVWTCQLSLTSRLAPRQLSALFIGGWYINIGVGTWLTGQVGALGYTWGIFEAFMLLAVSTILSAALVWRLTPWLTARMHGIEGD